jgi:hypothetical protein
MDAGPIQGGFVRPPAPAVVFLTSSQAGGNKTGVPQCREDVPSSIDDRGACWHRFCEICLERETQCKCYEISDPASRAVAGYATRGAYKQPNSRAPSEPDAGHPYGRGVATWALEPSVPRCRLSRMLCPCVPQPCCERPESASLAEPESGASNGRSLSTPSARQGAHHDDRAAHARSSLYGAACSRASACSSWAGGVSL